MINALMIKAEIVRSLKKIYEEYHFYGMEVIEGYKKPSFFVDVRLGSQTDESANVTKKVFSVCITYFQKQVNETDALKKIDEIKGALTSKDSRNKNSKMLLKVRERFLTIQDYSYGLTGKDNNIPQYSFDVSFYDFDNERNEMPEIERVEINTSLEEER